MIRAAVYNSTVPTRERGDWAHTGRIRALAVLRAVARRLSLCAGALTAAIQLTLLRAAPARRARLVGSPCRAGSPACLKIDLLPLRPKRVYHGLLPVEQSPAPQRVKLAMGRRIPRPHANGHSAAWVGNRWLQPDRDHSNTHRRGGVNQCQISP